MIKRFAACLLALSLLSNGVLAMAADEKDSAQTDVQEVVNEDVVETVEAKPTFVASSATAKPGETVTLKIDMVNNTGVSAIVLDVNYNSKYLSIASQPTLNTVFPEVLTSDRLEANPFIIVCVDDFNSIDVDCNLAEISFKVAEDAPSGDYIIKLSYDEGNVIDVDLNDVAFETISGVITVEGDIPPVSSDEGKEIYEPIEKPAADVIPEKEPVVPIFPDTDGHWAVEYVNKSVELGLFKGSEDGKFNPESKITRAQFITVLWRMAGSPEVEATHSFKDIDGQIDEFKKAIAWGYAKGYVSGVSEASFDPNGMLTREAGMKMLHYYSGGAVGREMVFYNIYDQLLLDSSEISDWARKSVYWGIYNMMISGTSDTTISPKEPMTRAQMAKIMVNYHNIDSFKN